MRASSKLIPFYILCILMVSFFYSSQAKSAQFDNPALNQNLKRIKMAWGRADFIIVGEVLNVGKPHHFQKVTYKILDVVYGRLPKKDMKQITVEHYLRSRSRLENPDPKKLELAPSLFSPGKRFIVMIEIDEDGFDDASGFGTFRYSEQNVKALQELILDRALEVLKSNISDSKYIIVGEVLSVGKPPGSYGTHYGLVDQKVTYKVLNVLKGQLPKKYMNKIVINYPMLGGRLEVPNEPRLSPSLFSPGNHLIAMIMIYKEGFDNIDQNFGTFPATDQNVKAMRQLIKGNLSEEQKISAVRQLISLQALD